VQEQFGKTFLEGHYLVQGSLIVAQAFTFGQVVLLAIFGHYGPLFEIQIIFRRQQKGIS
jgi:hypothetical protein